MAKILVVDDEFMLREIIRDELSENGHEVLEAASGAEALDILKASPVDLVVSDISMNQGDGIELLREATTTILRPPRFVFCSGYIESCPEGNGVVGFLRKPFQLNELVALVRSCT